MRKLSTNVVAAFVSDGVARAFGFAASVYLLRTLGKGGFGVYVIGTSIFSYALWFTDMGIGVLGSRETATPREQRQYQPSDILGFRLILCLPVLILAQVLIYALYGNSPDWNVYALFLFCLIPYVLLVEWYHQGLVNYVDIIISRTIGGVISIGLLVLMVHSTRDVIYTPLPYGLSTLGAALWLLLRKRRGDSLLSRFRFPQYRTIFRQISTISVGATFGQIVQLLPPIVLGIFCTTDDAGLFAAAAKVTYAVLSVDRVFATLYLPAFTSAWTTDRTRIVRLMPRVFIALTAFCIALCVCLGLFAEPVLVFIFGNEARGSADILAVLCWFVTWTLLNSFFAYSLIGIGREGSYSRMTTIGGVVAATSITVSAYLHHPLAVAVSVTGSELLIMSLMYREFRKHFSISAIAPLLIALVLSATGILLWRLVFRP